jgi:hypothetical protein
MEYTSITTEIVHADRRVAAAFGETHQPIHVSVQTTVELDTEEGLAKGLFSVLRVTETSTAL